MKIFLISLVGSLALIGCASTARLKTDDVQSGSIAKVMAKDVAVYSTTDAGGKQYDVIGQVVASSDAGEDASIPMNLLKEEAAALGADAVIDLRLEVDYGYITNAIKATATAVKLKKGTP
jgi:uncharacterized protein YbjQ (UPF0145 family)